MTLTEAQAAYDAARIALDAAVYPCIAASHAVDAAKIVLKYTEKMRADLEADRVAAIERYEKAAADLDLAEQSIYLPR